MTPDQLAEIQMHLRECCEALRPVAEHLEHGGCDNLLGTFNVAGRHMACAQRLIAAEVDVAVLEAGE
jgi:hypothetical protein